MGITQTLYITNPKDWRDWLKKNYKTEKEIWLVYPKKATGKPRIEYNNAVEEALCLRLEFTAIKTFAYVDQSLCCNIRCWQESK